MKKVTQSGLVLMFGLVLLSGCTTIGNESLADESPESIAQKVHQGVTTKEQLVAILGVPMETTFTDGGLEVLKYEYTRLKPRAQNFIPYNIISQVTDGKRKEIVVLLDQQSVVKRLIMNTSDKQIRFGIIE
ncbi:MAG: outer membrane protein assembly factor BamE (lipoprotein component of BamABCDE complex) [Candidatus Azotimanducaceae bacterium]|jgi:outer membrane protein assembly factor BamE (lipoprotein component of BamABCDE complex)